MLVAVEAGEAVILVYHDLIRLLLFQDREFAFDAVHKDITHGNQPGARVRGERLGGSAGVASAATDHSQPDDTAASSKDAGIYAQGGSGSYHGRSFQEVTPRCASCD